MAKIVRYNGNLKAFASEQLTNERTLFGQVTIANDLTSQITAQFLRGWGIVGPSDQPSLQDFNAAMYTNGQLLAYLHQMGVAEYNAAQEYFVGSLAQTGGALYISLVNANIGNTPSSSPASWKVFSTDQATEVALGLVKIATQLQTDAGTNDTNSVTPKKLAVAIQSQSFRAFTATNTPPSFAITAVPAITSYVTNQRFQVTFPASGGPNPTLNISGLGPKALKQYNPTANKVPAILTPGQTTDVFYDGVDFVVMTPTATGRLLGVKTFTASGVYTPSVGTTFIRFRMVGGGGASGGAPATTASQCSIGAPGSSGAYCEAIADSGFSGALVTVGSAGVGVSGAAGGSGGASSLGILASAPGGIGGTVKVSTTADLLNSAAGPAAGTGGYINANGNPGSPSIMLSITLGAIGRGGASQLGSSIYGAGADGTVNIPSAAAQVGRNGSLGVVIIEEYA